MVDKDLKNQLEEQFAHLEGSAVDLPAVNDNSIESLSSSTTALPQYSEATCPYLGLPHDRTSRFSYPEARHRCFAVGKETISLKHQSAVCFSQRYRTCTRFVEPPTEQLPTTIPSLLAPPSKYQKPGVFSLRRLILWICAGLLAVYTIVHSASFFIQQNPAADLSAQAVVRLTATPTPAPANGAHKPAQSFAGSEPTLTSKVPPVSPTFTPTPAPGGRIYTLSPAAADIGWVTSGEDLGNHFGDSFLYAGIFKGQIHQGAFQFNLSQIPRGAPIHQASIQLTGLRDDRLGQGGVWTLHLLVPEIDQDWRRRGYQDIFNAPTLQTLNPILGDQDLTVGKSNNFELSPAQIRLLEERIIDAENPTVSFRLNGPLVGPDNLFAWDTGYGSQSEGNKVTLFLNVGPPPATPPLYDYIVVTSTPTPENVVTAAAIARQMTAEATRIGTTTPPPPNLATATPIPAELIITPTPTPENEATAQALVVLATAYAFTTGTPTPFPTNAVTATPLPSSTPTPTYMVITATPTPESVFVAATMSAAATAEALRVGTPTPLPANWVTPIIVTATPTPANTATAQALAELATAQAFTTGTPTPSLGNVQTATPTPISIAVQPLASPTATATPTATPQPIPPTLLGKIVFLSGREGATEEERLRADKRKATPEIIPQPYVFDPATGQLERLTAMWPYEVAVARESWSADMTYEAYTKLLLWTNIRTERGNEPTEVLAIHYYDYLYNVEQIVTRMGAGIVYDPAWSPVSNEIAFVATESGNDEIWLINHDGTNAHQLTRNQWEWDKHPSWSPDGQQIVFFSNRTGNNQLWIMNKDGSEQRLLIDWNSYNDWNPVWIKYLEPPPPSTRELDWRFIKPPQEGK